MNTVKSILLLLVCSLVFVSLENCASSRSSNVQIFQGIERIGKKYVLYNEVDLKGNELIIPEGCVLSIRKGKIKNGTVKGCGNKILYTYPFIGENLVIEGCYVEDNVLRSESVLVKNQFSNLDIHNVYGLAREGTTVIYEKGIYKEVKQIDIDKSIEMDFSNATIETALDNYDLCCSVFMTEAENAKSIKKVTIKNVVIDGKKPFYGQESGAGPRRNAIRLVNIKNVTLENVVIKNFRYGTNGYYAKDVKKRHMAGVCTIMNYTNCTIQNCNLSKNTGEGFYLVPEENERNYLLFKGNSCQSNYGTLLTLVDGRCLVEDNELNGFGLSGMNVFCYNSIIRNNRFRGGERFNCIDITENGLYWPRNVEIYGNEAEDCEGFIMAAGKNVSIERNICRNPRSAFALTIFGYSPTTKETKQYLIQRNTGDGKTIVTVKDNDWECKGGIATYSGCKAQLHIKGNRICIIPDEIEIPHRGTALELKDCRDVIIEGNIFNDSFRNSITQSNVYITMNGCSGNAIIRSNNFARTLKTPDKTSYFLFTQETKFDRMTIEDNTSNVDGISVRAAEGELTVRGKRTVRGNSVLVVK